MDEQEIVKDLTKRGMVVTPEMLKRIRSGEPPTTTPKTKPPPTRGLSVRISGPTTKNRMSVKDVVSYYNKRYALLRDLLLKKMPAVSINKLADNPGEASTIGMVKARSKHGFTLEDITGEIDVVDGEPVRDDDVVGVRGAVKEGRLFASSLVWPDVEQKEKTPLDTKLLLTTSLEGGLMDVVGDFGVVLVTGKPAPDIPEEVRPRVFGGLPNPCVATISKAGKELVVLIYHPKEQVTLQDAVGMLRRRHLMPARSEIFTSDTDPYMIELTPDLFWVVSDNTHIDDYRGVRVVMGGKAGAVKLDASTGEVFFANQNPAQRPPTP